MMIHKQTYSVDCKCWLKSLENQPNEPANQNAIIVPKIVKNFSAKEFFFLSKLKFYGCGLGWLSANDNGKFFLFSN